MKRLLSLTMALLLLLTLHVSPARGEEGDPASDPPAGESEGPSSAETAEPGSEPALRDALSWEKSLAYWEQIRGDIPLTGDMGADVLTIARSQLGYSADWRRFEVDASGRIRYSTRYGEWFGWTFSEWCDMFASFCVYYAGKTDYPAEVSCMRHVYALKEAGYWREWNCYIPQAGDLVFFSEKEGSLFPNHVAVIEEVVPGDGTSPSRLITIDGNMPNSDGPTRCVCRMTRSVEDVVGYGTYAPGKTYPAGDTVRSQGWQIIGPDSEYFVDAPTEEALRFLGLIGSPYYAYWFPQATEAADAAAQGADE